MYAVVETGGKQYRVEVGTEFEVELLDAEPGQAITLDRVLLIADGDDSAIGRPVVADAAVSAEVLRRVRGEKLISFKYRPKARSRVKKGHRQELTILRVTDVRFGSKSAAEAARKADADAKSERQRLEEAAARQAAEDAALAAKLAKASAEEKKKSANKARATTPTGTEEGTTKAKPTKATKPKASTEAADSSAKATSRPTAAKAAPKTTPKKPASSKPAKKDE